MDQSFQPNPNSGLPSDQQAEVEELSADLRQAEASFGERYHIVGIVTELPDGMSPEAVQALVGEFPEFEPVAYQRGSETDHGNVVLIEPHRIELFRPEVIEKKEP